MSSTLTEAGWVVRDDIVDERQPLPRLTQAEIDAINAEIAAGSNNYPTGTQVIRTTDESVFQKWGVGTAARFVQIGNGADVTETLAALQAQEAESLATLAAAAVFTQAGTGAAARTFQNKARDIVSVRDFGATGDGTTDDTTAVHAAITYAKGVGAAVYFPIGIYRVTSGYTQSTVRGNVALVGPTRTASDTSNNLGAIILLDSASGTSFFYSATAAHHLFVGNLRFRSAQFVTDRDFFRFSGVPVNHGFHRVAFENIDRPIVYQAGAYFESSSFFDVMFYNSGTIYSDSNVGSRGNLMTLVNVYSGGTMPANTNKIVCNLQGIRGIQGTNFLLQGSLPSTGWEVLRLDNDYDSDWTRTPIAQFNGFWSEWSGTAPTYTVRQHGGLVIFSNSTMKLDGANRQYKLEQSAQVRIIGSSFNENATAVGDMFAFEDTNCNVVLDQCTLRGVSKAHEQITYINCSYSASGSADNLPVAAALFGTQQSAVAFRWTGGYLPSDGGALTLGGGTTGTPSTDATYGRKYVFTPNVDALQAIFYASQRGTISVGTQYNIVVFCQLPTFTGGTFAIQPMEGASALAGGASYDTTYSATVVRLNINRRALTAGSIGVRFNSSATGVSGTLDVFAVGIYIGNESPRLEYPPHPTNVITHNSAAPTAGAWARGDVVWNTTPSGGGAPGWVCTAAGTPGTWKAMANLAA